MTLRLGGPVTFGTHHPGPQNLDAVVAAIGHVHRAVGVDRDGLWEFHLPDAAALAAPDRLDVTAWPEGHDAAVVGVSDVDGAARVDGHAVRIAELTGRPTRQQLTFRRELGQAV